MSFLKDLLNKVSGEPRRPSGASRMIRSETTPSPVRYVDALLAHLLEHKQGELVLRAGEPLPAVEGSQANQPTCEQVINRLKALSGLAPSKLNQPTSGTFEHVLKHRTVRVQANFADQGGESSCRVSANDISGARRTSGLDGSSQPRK